MTIEELKQAYEAATPGPLFIAWSEVSETLEITCDARKGMVGIVQIETGFNEDFDAKQKANARLIVEAVNNLPALLKVVDAARTYQRAMSGFAEAVRQDTGKPYPWEPGDIADEALSKALEELNDE